MSDFGRFIVATGCLATGYVSYHLAKDWWNERVPSGPPSSLPAVVCVSEGVPTATPIVEDGKAVFVEEVALDVEEEERIAARDRAEIAFMLDVIVKAVETSLEGTTGGHLKSPATTRSAEVSVCKSRKEWMAIWKEPKKKKFKGLRKFLKSVNCFR